MGVWETLLSLLILFTAALTLGTLAQELRQSSIIGYLAAGMLVGPHALGWVGEGAAVASIAELGVALLLFSIGLEFSFKRLLSLGPVTFGGGTAQVVLTAAAVALICRWFGLDWRVAVALGAMASLSSTACVVRILVDNAQIDSIWGRSSIGILLLQDIAVVPLVLLVAALGGESSPYQSLLLLGRTVLLGALMFGAFYAVVNYLLPRLLTRESWARNRELPVLLAIVSALGSSWAAHAAGLSPSFGAFLAGLLLAGSPYAMQIRADISPLRSLLVTLFFAGIGLLVDPLWIVRHPFLTAGTAVLVLALKPLIVLAVMKSLRYGAGIGLATGLALGQVGEFSFVLAGIAASSGLLEPDLFRLVISVTVLTLFVTPYLVQASPSLCRVLEGFGRQTPLLKENTGQSVAETGAESSITDGRIIIIGFGPAGQRVAEGLYARHKQDLLVLDLNQRNSKIALSYGLEFMLGDARLREVLEHAHIDKSMAVIITLPDPETCRMIIHLIRVLAPAVRIFARARYHVVQWDLMLSGAEVVVSEEDQVGTRLAEEVLSALHSEDMPSESG
jgi:monovalent cation:H+ antiporter-2, CPA2 family